MERKPAYREATQGTGGRETSCQGVCQSTWSQLHLKPAKPRNCSYLRLK